LARSAVAVVSVPATGVGIAAQVLGQLGAHAPLKDGLEHLVQKAVLASQLQPSRTGLGEYVIDQRVREHLPAKPSSIRYIRSVLVVNRPSGHEYSSGSTHTDHLTRPSPAPVKADA